MKWEECKVDDPKPTARSGHTIEIVNGKIFIFGGILEVTKEINDLFCYDIAKCKWENLYEVDAFNKTERSPDGNSPRVKASPAIADHNRSVSPKKNPKNDSSLLVPKSTANINNSTSVSPGTKRSLGKSMSPRKMPSGMKAQQKAKNENEEEKGLTSPTSITMKNSFIIKNADASFDSYYV